MSAETRRIEHLRLRAQRSEDVPRAHNLLVEALRLASMPGEGQPGRLFIRRIELPALRLERGASAVANVLAEQIRALRRTAVLISDPRAAQAEVVFARDALEPLVLALLRATRGQALTEWFWSQVLLELQPGATPARVATLVWRALLEQPNSSNVIPAVVGAVLDASPAPDVFSAIDASLGQALARALGVQLLEGHEWPLAIATIAPVRWRSTLQAAITACERDVRAAWLVTAAARAVRPWSRVIHLDAAVEMQAPRTQPRGASSAAPSISVAAHARIDAPESQQARHELESAVTTLGEASHALPIPAVPASAHALETKRPAPSPVPTAAKTASSLAPPTLHSVPALSRWALLERPAPTPYGGLFFLVYPLRRLGLEQFLESHPALEQHAFGMHVLAGIANDLQIPLEDPIRLAVRAPELPQDLIAPPAPTWSELALAAPQPEGIEGLLCSWTHAVNTYLKRVELELREVVQRPAAVSCSRTHLDVLFDMRVSDVQIRKAGLDIDPGFVRWLGRVVRFHYLFQGMLDA